MDRVILEISWGSLWRVFFFVLLTVIFFWSKTIFLGLFLALVISSGIDPIITWMERRGLPRTVGVTLIFLLGAFFVILVLYALIPRLIIDTNSVLINLRTQPFFEDLGIKPFFDLSYSQSIPSLVNEISRRILGGDDAPLSFLAQALGGITMALTVLVTSFYLSLSRDGVERFLRVVLPDRYESLVVRLYSRSRGQVAMWFRTQIILSFFVGVLVWATMSLLGVKHALLLGILAAILEIIPFVGPIVAGAVAVISALTTSSSLALLTAVVFVVIQQVEAHLFLPVLFRRSVGLHPVIVITSLLIGAQLEGILGMLIAVPAAAVLQEIVEDWSDQRRHPEKA